MIGESYRVLGAILEEKNDFPADDSDKFCIKRVYHFFLFLTGSLKDNNKLYMKEDIKSCIQGSA